MISKLTKSQQTRLTQIRDEWIKKGLSTEQATIEEARRIVRDFDQAFFQKERPILYLSSPLGCWLGVSLFSSGYVGQQVEQQVGKQVWQQVGQQVEQQVEQQVGQQVGQQVWQQVGQQVEQQVRQQVGQQVEQQVWQQVRQQVWQQVWQQVEQQVGQQVDNGFVWPYLPGHFWADYFSWVESMVSIGVTGISEDFEVLKQCHRLGLFYPLNDIIIVGSTPTALHFNLTGSLHEDEAAAVEYADGWKLYFLNGVAMSPEQVLTPAEQLTPDQVLKETNADRRRELIRKIGIERMLSKLTHDSMDRLGDYELLSIHLSDETDARYLRMLNPSIGVFHLEGVDPSCKTVVEALNWRNSNWHTNAEILT